MGAVSAAPWEKPCRHQPQANIQYTNKTPEAPLLRFIVFLLHNPPKLIK